MKNALTRYAGRETLSIKTGGPAQTSRPLNSISTLPHLDSSTALEVQRFEEWLLAEVGCWRAGRHAEQKRGGRAHV